MFKLQTPFYVYNRQYKRNFLIMYTNMGGAFIDENKVVHCKSVLNEATRNCTPKISKAGLV